MKYGISSLLSADTLVDSVPGLFFMTLYGLVARGVS